MKLNKLALVANDVVKAYTNGETLASLSKVYDVSPGTIRNLLIKKEIPLRKQGRRKKENENGNDGSTVQPNTI